ncbi:DUF3821 domain-containing protein [Methanolacinia petrolearia]|nr:DUF3821 domain-containing protein [Methanolacinia petrolearia]
MNAKIRFAMLIFVIVSSLAMVSPAAAVLTNIHEGDSVFLGEQGLVLASDVFYSSGGVSDDQLAYYGGGNPATGTPDYVLTPSKNSFYVDPSVFSSRLGLWYSYPNGSKNSYASISVLQPSLDLRLWAYRSGGESFDITNGKIVKGEALDFRIDSNLYPIFQRAGVTSGDDGIDVKVRNQVGATLTALINCNGASVSIVNVHPTTQQYFLPSGTLTCVWDTGNSQYNAGSYTVWAECNVNGMKDNLGSIEGETITPTLSSLKSTSTPTPTATTSTKTATPTATKTNTPTPTSTLVVTQVATTSASTPEETAVTPVQTEKTQATTATTTPTETQSPMSSVTLIISVVFAAIMIFMASKKE